MISDDQYLNKDISAESSIIEGNIQDGKALVKSQDE